MIVAQGLTRRFGELLAVDRLNLSVGKGEVLGFLGPNGAGKTTTVRMLSGLIAPSAGRARVAGFDVQAQPQEVRRRVGVLTESPGLYDRLSARRNLEVFAALQEVAAPKVAAEKYLRLLDLWDRRDDPAGSYSKGMRQRLAICRAMLHEPPVVFLDEPTSALDPESARAVRSFIGSLRDQGRTVFLCTHNLAEAEQVCDRVAMFSTRLLVLDTPQVLRQQVFGRQVIVELDEVLPAYVAAVRAVPGVREVLDEGQRLRLRSEDPDRDNPDIIAALVGAGARVRFVREERPTLEQVYLALIAQARERAP
jgi:ABC-2 type transport system ATP-binding protein